MGRTPGLRDEIFLMEVNERSYGAHFYSLLLLLPVSQRSLEDSCKTDMA